MKKLVCLLISMLLLILFILIPAHAKAPVQNQNDLIILIHGLAGWRDEVPLGTGEDLNTLRNI